MGSVHLLFPFPCCLIMIYDVEGRARKKIQKSRGARPLSRSGGGVREARWFTSRMVSLRGRWGGGLGATAGLGGRISGFFHLPPPGLASVAAFLDWALRSQADPQTKWTGPVARHRSYVSRRARAEVPVVTTVPGAQRPGSRRAADCGSRESGFSSRASMSLTSNNVNTSCVALMPRPLF